MPLPLGEDQASVRLVALALRLLAPGMSGALALRPLDREPCTLARTLGGLGRGEQLAARVEDRAADALLFAGPSGAILRNGNFRRRVFDDAALRAGVPGVTPHGLRHTAASLAVQAGATVVAVQRMLGHASPTVTLNVYSHLFADDLDTVAERLDEARSRASADQVRTEGDSITGDEDEQERDDAP